MYAELQLNECMTKNDSSDVKKRRRKKKKKKKKKERKEKRSKYCEDSMRFPCFAQLGETGRGHLPREMMCHPCFLFPNDRHCQW